MFIILVIVRGLFLKVAITGFAILLLRLHPPLTGEAIPRSSSSSSWLLASRSVSVNLTNALHYWVHGKWVCLTLLYTSTRTMQNNQGSRDRAQTFDASSYPLKIVPSI